ncbi:P-loop containing nucleoside triphosphate hydrolase protein [Durotheca rogersii]|uniref:P-loop containing nucleoside triphosphate hydrolase protein n=1 Tax=Durotheca rogersii TaxID=419775 RepID=UPI00221EB1C6|nr:P-loop containing nucleoside triphosphate hydrolase protein [Durotheca rogersii]KAI5865108.1 P-loop containing nucleoside triphosphate hydrolase protein [Durotheca rogersii]
MANSINKPKKAKSKRTPVRLRHKIEKASAAKQRKARKQAKKNPQWKSKLKKDPGIPNLFPYKERILHEIEEGKRRKQEEQQRRRELAKAAKTGTATEPEDVEGAVSGAEGEDFAEFNDDHDDAMDEDDVDDDSNPMAALLASARAAAEKYDRELQSGDDMDEDGSSVGGDGDGEEGGAELRAQASSRKAHDKVFKQVVDQADVVLYVLDARNPEGTRSREVERMVMAAASGGKRLILVLNKIDLIPPHVLKGWLAYLRRYFPTLPLRASGPAPNAQTFNHRDLTVQSTSATLFKSLKSFAATKQLKRAISVGVIGYPNVGKSSVINALLSRLGGRGVACPAGAEAGVTTSIRTVKIDSKLTLLDSPGIVFPSAPNAELSTKKNPAEAHAHLILLNAIPPKQIEDPIPAVTLLLKRLSASPDLLQKLMDVYDLPPLIPSFKGDSTTDFLVQVARKRGRLGRGGVPNLTSAAMAVVTDWRDGRIQGWIDTPVFPVATEIIAKIGEVSQGIPGVPAVMPDQKEIVTEWAKEFKLEGLWGDGDDTQTDVAMEQ